MPTAAKAAPKKRVTPKVVASTVSPSDVLDIPVDEPVEEAIQETAWSKLVREAKSNLKVHKPYVFDACDPPVLITAPVGLERSLALAQLTTANEDTEISNLIPMLEALVGADVFGAVWIAIRDEPIEVTLALIDEINQHFTDGAGEGAEDFPGGASAS
ncbi:MULTISPECIES: hypothetical protein [Nocardia]|uniref:hypothetical protein n=1 Tax=Nocardia TaxID=1817 RepID=UPI00130092C8|nr:MULTISPECIES: hypothetical protein [Nocardia]